MTEAGQLGDDSGLHNICYEEISDLLSLSTCVSHSKGSGMVYEDLGFPSSCGLEAVVISSGVQCSSSVPVYWYEVGRSSEGQ